MLGRTYRGTMYKCYERGFNNLYRTPFKYTYNTSFFNQVTLQTCYWAAILTTDGSITIRKDRPTITWGAAEKDRMHIELFKTTIESTHPIKQARAKCGISTRDPNRYHEYRTIVLESPHEWVKDLAQHFGVTHNKTLRCPPPKLPSLLHRLAYIRGFIDGDGTVTSTKTDGTMEISICGVNREMIAWIKEVIDGMNLPTAKKVSPSMVHQRKDENCYYFSVRGFRAAVLFELLRRVSVPNLSRKWDNPTILAIVDRWKARKDLWPSDLFFSNLLSLNDIDA